MIQGTGSGAGKSMIVAALCRTFKDMGIDVAPFKAQNMALNSYITADGGEIGRAQALQAEAAGIEPTIDMNPILLKASGESGSQVVIHGRVHSNMKANEYYAFRKNAWVYVKSSFDRLSKKHDLIVIEGAGSPAEINLLDGDIVNMTVAKYAKAPVVLVGDIDKGGVFASFYGTVKLLGRDARNIKAFIINKFRGDIEILRPGCDMIREKTGRPVIGVLPYVFDIGLPEEDGMALYRQSTDGSRQQATKTIKVVVVRLKYISNFTDFDPFVCEPQVELVYSTNPADIENTDIVILPGSKNTVKDLLYLKEQDIDDSIRRAYAKGIQIIGICGGYQMLGKKISDPHKVESSQAEIDGIGLLNIETTMEKTKITCQVEAEIAHRSWLMAHDNKNYKLSAMSYQPLAGYEIHMGITSGGTGLFKVKNISSSSGILNPGSGIRLDGSMNGNCWGTYMHGIFDNDEFRTAILNQIRMRKALPAEGSNTKYLQVKERALNRLAVLVRDNIDMDFIKKAVKL